MTLDPSGNVVVADSTNNRVRVIVARTGSFYGQQMKAGYVYTVAGTGDPGFSGDGGQAAKAMLSGPAGVSADHAGNLLIAANQRIRVVAAKTGTFYGQQMTAGDIYTVVGDGDGAFSGDGGPAINAGISPVDAAVNATGNVIIADQGNQRVRMLAVKTGTFFGQRMTAGDIYTIAGSGHFGFSGNGGLATAADFGGAAAVTVDRDGNVAIDDEFNSVVWLLAARTGSFYGQGMVAGHIYVVAGGGTSLGADGLGDGGPATSARLDNPAGVAFDPAGDLLVADLQDARIRAISG